MTKIAPHSDAASVEVNGIRIVYDTFGEASAPPMLLIQGLGQQMISWDDEFCAALAARGYWVTRFDNRDIGLSTRFDEAGVPDILGMMQALEQGDQGRWVGLVVRGGEARGRQQQGLLPIGEG